MALPRRYRLRLKKDFALVKAQGKLFQTPFFSLLVLSDLQLKNALFGFLISKRVDNKAVVRNRIRRILSEAVRLQLPGVGSGFKVIFLAKSVLKTKKMSAVFPLIERSLTEAGILKSK